MIDIGHGLIFDGNYTAAGDPIAIEHNNGAWLNHSTNPNCVLRIMNKGDTKKVFIYTKYVIPKSWELTWNYGDKSSNAPEWMHN